MGDTCLTLNPLIGFDIDIMPIWCNGWASDHGKTQISVPYDWTDLDESEGSDPAGSIQLGADLLDTMIGENIGAGHVYAFGHSKGGQVISRWLTKYGDTSGYSNTALTFIFTGNPLTSATPYGRRAIVSNPTPTSTAGGYPIIDIGRKGDGWCRGRWDSPTIPELIQNYIGMFSDHMNYSNKYVLFDGLGVNMDANGVPSEYLSTDTIGDTTFYTVY